MVALSFEVAVLTDLLADLPEAVRLQSVVARLREHFGCGAVALLRLEGDHLRPVAVDGLVSEALGRRFAVSEHPRLAAILARRGVTRFNHDSNLPDPYDGLIDEHAGEPLPVHDCMGTSLTIEGKTWGVLTLDALRVGTFDEQSQSDLAAFILAIEAAIRTSRLEAEIRALRLTGGDTPESGAPREDSEILGQSEAIAHLLHELVVVADSELPVLLLGETGVGKELFARRLHRLSRRRGKPLVHVNCAALPESLAESELFGHAKGAFSGAVSSRPGRFEAADGGTLLLDEVGELPLTVQAKLLRALQDGEIQRLGADQPLRVDVRIIAATNRSLRDLVHDGVFRADLYHRLSVYPIPIPPLRERGDDVLLLAGRFLELNRARLGLRSLRLSQHAQAALLRYSWPGNVRELEHAISRAALKALSRGASRNEIVTLEADLLDLGDLPGPGQEAPAPADLETGAVVPAPALSAAAKDSIKPLRDAVDQFQRDLIRRSLAVHGASWARSAAQLQIDPSNLRKLARRLGLKQ